MTDDRWVVIPRWDDFQHRDMARSTIPPWIKVYTEIDSKDDYLGLSFHLRGVLLGLWVEYATSKRQLRGSTLTLTRRLGQRVTTRDLQRLNDAGFITLSASKPASNVDSEPASLEVEVEKKRPSTGVRSKPKDRLNGQRQRAAENWIRNGLAAHIPNDQLPTVIADEFHIEDPDLLQQLVQQATTDDIPY